MARSVRGQRTLKLIALIDAFTDRLGRLIAWLLPAMVAGTLAVVVLRYAFAWGSIALQESVLYMHGIVFMLGIPYTLKEDAHVRVDLVYGRLGPRARALVNLCGHLLFLLPVAAAIIVYSWSYVARSWSILEGSPEVGGVPGIFLLKSLIPLAAALLLVQGLAEILRALLVLTRRHG